MRIVLDLQGAQSASRFRGIGRYSLALAQAIARQRGNNDTIIALNGLFPETIEPLRAAFDGLVPQDNIRVWYAPAPVCWCAAGNSWRRAAAERIRSAFLASLQPDLIHVSSLIEGYSDDAVTGTGKEIADIPTVVTLYDVIPLLNPDSYLRPNPSYEQFYRHKIEELKRADGWLAISDFSALECCDALGLQKKRVFPISTACDPVFCCNGLKSVEMGLQLHPDRSFILYSGGADERKNLSRLIRAYASLSEALRQSHQLVFAGKMAEANMHDLQTIAHRAGLRADELLFTGYVSDEQLSWLYQNCTLFVFPSWHEGFGLPVLEAMSSGAPAIAANSTSLPEVLGWQEALFDPYSEEAIAVKINQALTDELFRGELIRRGLEQARHFSWDACAQRAISAFEELLASHRGNSADTKNVSLVNTLITEIAALSENAAPSESDLVATAWAIGQNHPGNQSKQLFVDISELVQRDARSGVQRVTRSILLELLKNPPAGYQVEPVFASVDVLGYRYARSFSAKIMGHEFQVDGDAPIEPRPGDLFLGLDLQHHVVRSQEPYLDHLYQMGVPVHFVVYDLLPVLLPHVFPPGATEGHALWLRTITRYSGAVCISQAVAHELSAWMEAEKITRLRPYSIGWFHLGADVENSMPLTGMPENAEHLLGLLACRPSFLMVGTMEPRKGYVQAVAAFEQLWAEAIDVNLVIVGKQGWMMGALADHLRNHPERLRRLFWLEGISDEYLEKVYGVSSCLIAASEGEGFGLPLIEAAQHGLPIIARDIPVFREVAGDYPSYYNGSDAPVLATAIKQHLLAAEAEKPMMTWLTWAQSATQIKQALGLQQSS